MDKDESIDRLLRHTAAAREGTRMVDSCLDVETLAAWTDGSLTAADRAAAEAHAADCDRCLSVLAAIAKTTPPLPDTHHASWFRLRWLVPLTTAAVAITAWIVIQEPQPRSVTEGTQATGATQQKQGESGQRQLLRGREPEAESRDPREAEPSAQATEETRKKHSSASEPSPQEALAKKETASPALSRDTAAAYRSGELADKREPANKFSLRIDELRSLPGRPAEKPDVPESAAAAPAAKPRNEIAERLGSRIAQQGPVLIVSPDQSVRWRLVGTTVERSIDGGRTWTPQATGANGELRAGSAPAADVCWIVGRSGVVLLSTDGRTWRRLEFPDPGADLIAVAAVDRATATVTAADGRTYRTTDAGRTWTLQETPAAPF